MSQPLAIWVDGQSLAADGPQEWPLDRGIQYGDGLFETMIARAGRIRFLALHRRRFAEGCQRLRIEVPSALWPQVLGIAQQHGDAVLKLLVTRGTSAQRGYGITGNEQCRSILYVYDAPAADLPATINVVTLQARLGENPALAGIKHCNRLEQVLGRIQLQATGAFEGLMASGSGRLISGTMSNVFLDTGSGLVTPVLDQCGIVGVLRAVALGEATAMGLPVRVADVPLATLDDIRGLFLTNARLGVLPVSQLNGRAMRISDDVRALAHRVANLEN